jgi:hypothetical protein
MATDIFPKPEASGKHTHQVYIAVTHHKQRGKTFSDQRGRFIIPSSTDCTQLFILYKYNSGVCIVYVHGPFLTIFLYLAHIGVWIKFLVG